MAKSLISFVEELVKLFCCNYWQNPAVTAAVHYVHYNSHHHYHFHYDRKMHLCCLKILLIVPLCNIPVCLSYILSSFYQLNFIFLFKFCLLIPIFSFFTPSKRTQNSITTIRHVLDVLFILIFISIVTYTEAAVYRYSSK